MLKNRNSLKTANSNKSLHKTSQCIAIQTLFVSDLTTRLYRLNMLKAIGQDMGFRPNNHDNKCLLYFDDFGSLLGCLLVHLAYRNEF